MSSSQLPFFVYGTLRPKEENYHLLAGHTLRETAAYLEGFQLYSLGAYPMIIRTNNPAHVVRGELVVVKDDVYAEVQKRLDWLEEYDPLHPPCPYYRMAEAVTLATTEAHMAAWVYVGNPDFLQQVPHQLILAGDWVQHRYEMVGER